MSAFCRSILLRFSGLHDPNSLFFRLHRIWLRLSASANSRLWMGGAGSLIQLLITVCTDLPGG
jgi:hypothetical protein